MKVSKKQLALISGGALVLTVIAALALLANRLFISDNPWPDLEWERTANQREYNEFYSLVGRSADIGGVALHTGDLSGLTGVFIDDASIPLNREQTRFLDEARTNQKNQDLSGNGWLTYERAVYLSLQNGASAQQYRLTSEAQGRTMSSDDYHTIGAPVPQSGQIPTALPAFATKALITASAKPSPTYQWPPAPNQKDSRSVTIDRWGLRGKYITHNGDSLRFRHYFLVKTTSGWRIAGERVMPTNR